MNYTKRWLVRGMSVFVFFLLAGAMGRYVHAATSEQVEKALTASTTKKVQYLRGRYLSKKSVLWKTSTSLSLVTERWTVQKKGWYAFRIKKTTGKYQVFYVKLKKKTYHFPQNEAKKIVGNDYQLSMKTKKGMYINRTDDIEGAGTIRLEKEDQKPGDLWTPEVAAGKNFRLKNKKSGEYLVVDAKGNLVVKPLENKDNASIFRAIKADKNYLFLWHKGTKKYLHLTDAGWDLMPRKNKKEWKFLFQKPKTSPAGQQAAPDKILPCNMELIKAIGCQSVGTDLEKKACASYALAYCHALLDKTAICPSTYWVSSTNVDCVWSAGQYTTAYYNTPQETLYAAYMQIASGKPCILRVSGVATTQHWLALIGYKNIADLGNLSVANFVAIDPWDGKQLMVGDKYKVVNVFRLAYYANLPSEQR